jgi:hypothetical protein
VARDSDSAAAGGRRAGAPERILIIHFQPEPTGPARGIMIKVPGPGGRGPGPGTECTAARYRSHESGPGASLGLGSAPDVECDIQMAKKFIFLAARIAYL